MIVNVSAAVVEEIRESTNAETPDEVAAALEDCWMALENAPQVVERHREQQVVAE